MMTCLPVASAASFWTCPDCGKKNPASYTVCSKCGYGEEEEYPWDIVIPKGFELIDESEDSVLYYDEDKEMEIQITWEKPNVKKLYDYMAEDYDCELDEHDSVTYKELQKTHDEISGYQSNKTYIYYVQGQIGSSTFCKVSFFYPTVNRKSCDKLLEHVRDSLMVS